MTIFKKGEFSQNRDKFTETKQLHLQNIDYIKKELQKFESEYIEANRRFEIGEKVVVITPERMNHFGKTIPGKKEFAFVDYFHITYDNKIETNLVKVKKDGTPSKHKLYENEALIHKIID